MPCRVKQSDFVGQKIKTKRVVMLLQCTSSSALLSWSRVTHSKTRCSDKNYICTSVPAGWCIMMRALGMAKRLPFAPAASSTVAVLAHSPIAIVHTSGLIASIVSKSAITEYDWPPAISLNVQLSTVISIRCNH